MTRFVRSTGTFSLPTARHIVMRGRNGRDYSVEKNVQVIDGAINSEYAIYAFEDPQFEIIFPEEGQDIEFIEDVLERITPAELGVAFRGVWDRKVHKSSVSGIHGTLFYELTAKKVFYPNKKESDLGSRGFVDLPKDESP